MIVEKLLLSLKGCHLAFTGVQHLGNVKLLTGIGDVLNQESGFLNLSTVNLYNHVGKYGILNSLYNYVSYTVLQICNIINNNNYYNG